MKTVMRFDVTVAVLMLICMPAMAQTPDALPSEDGSAVDVAEAATQSIDADLESKTANEEAMAEQAADEDAKQRGAARVGDVFPGDGRAAVPQRLEGADLRALLLHHARHGRHRHQRGNEEEEHRKHL